VRVECNAQSMELVRINRKLASYLTVVDRKAVNMAVHVASKIPWVEDEVLIAAFCSGGGQDRTGQDRNSVIGYLINQMLHNSKP